jgi:hypothetical protein
VAAAKSRPTAAKSQATTTGRKAAGRSAKPQTVSGTVEVVSRRPTRDAAIALERAVRRESRQIHLPLIGKMRLPSAEDLIYYGGVTALVAVGMVEWPVALLLGIGHELAASKHRSMLRAFGEALEVL